MVNPRSKMAAAAAAVAVAGKETAAVRPVAFHVAREQARRLWQEEQQAVRVRAETEARFLRRRHARRLGGVAVWVGRRRFVVAAVGGEWGLFTAWVVVRGLRCVGL